jgi:hypothetical protein
VHHRPSTQTHITGHVLDQDKIPLNKGIGDLLTAPAMFA